MAKEDNVPFLNRGAQPPSAVAIVRHNFAVVRDNI
jgi:hypothetical protein